MIVCVDIIHHKRGEVAVEEDREEEEKDGVEEEVEVGEEEEVGVEEEEEDGAEEKEEDGEEEFGNEEKSCINIIIFINL